MVLGSNSSGAGEMSCADTSLRTSPLAGFLPRKMALPSARENVVLDCTRGERLGLRGPGTLEWIGAEGLILPDTVNSALTLSCGTSILRLGSQEVLLTAPAGDEGARLRKLRVAWQDSKLSLKGYDTYRDESWAWFVVAGEAAPLLMSRISMADLRPQSIKAGQIVQTRALHQDAMIARLDRFGGVSYDVFLDIASSEFALGVMNETAKGIHEGFQFAELRFGN